MAGMIAILYLPRCTSYILLILRLLISTIICYINYRRFHTKSVCHESTYN